MYAVRRRWDGGACVIEVSPAAIDEDEEGKEEEVLEQTEEQTEEEEGNEVGSSSSPEDLSRRIDESVLEVSLPTVSVSLVDDGDERLLWSLDGIALRSGSRLGVDGGGAFTELRVLATQVDDQHPHTAFPVLLYHNPRRGALLDFAVTSAPPLDESDASHPGLCVNVTPGGLHLRVHEPLIWRLRAFVDKIAGGGGANGGAANGSRTGPDGGGDGAMIRGEGRKTAAVDDPSMSLGLLRVSSVGVRLTFKPTPRSRPSTVGPALASVLAFLNLDRLPITVGAFVRHRARLKRSDIARQVVGHVKGEAVSQFFAVLSSVNHLGNVAGTLDQFGDNIRRLGNLGLKDAGDATNGDGGGGGGGGGGDDDDDATTKDAEYPYAGAAGFLVGGRAGGGVVAAAVEKNVITGALTGGSELAMNVVGGVGGIFTKSAAGFQRSGISGLASGTARGIGGLVAGAAAGAVGAVARVVEGVDATVGAAQDQVKGAQTPPPRFAVACLSRRGATASSGLGTRTDAAGLHLLRVASRRDSLGVRRFPFAGARFEAALPLEEESNGVGATRGGGDSRVVLLSHRHVGCVATATGVVEWILPWARVASVGVDGDVVVVHARGAVDGGGDGGADAFGGVLGIGSVGKTSGGDVDRAKRFARCGSAERARVVAERTREAWAAHAARGGATGGGGI